MFYTEGALSLPVRPGNMGFLIYRDSYSIFWIFAIAANPARDGGLVTS